jgi:hypothetical protein
MCILIILIRGLTAAFGFNYILVLYQATIYACIHVTFVHHVLYTIWLCTIEGFNVSNLMGIKRRMIDIGKKITFYFLQIV